MPEPAKSVDVQAYQGRWYELARFDNRFERGCEGVTADYTLRPNGELKVVNTCRKGAPDGPVKQAKGWAKVVPDSGNAKLKVSFFGPFFGDYWVLDHADDYAWTIVGEPTGGYLWIMARNPRPDAETIATLKARATALGYDISTLRDTRQPPS
ncbi:MAG: lipocalin family protein [Caulobacterales bacterium]